MVGGLLAPRAWPPAPSRGRDARSWWGGAALWSRQDHESKEYTVPVIAIIGAGPGLGAAVARRFGREGFSIALISRNQSKLDAMAADLKAGGLTARGYAADVLVPAALEDALARAAAELGPITTLQYSPLPSREYLKPV